MIGFNIEFNNARHAVARIIEWLTLSTKLTTNMGPVKQISAIRIIPTIFVVFLINFSWLRRKALFDCELIALLGSMLDAVISWTDCSLSLGNTPLNDRRIANRVLI